MTSLSLTWDDKTYLMPFIDLLPVDEEHPVLIHVRVGKQLSNKAYIGHLGRAAEFNDPPGATTEVVCKLGRGREEIKSLEKEYDVYMDNLMSLQGTIVPRCFGLYADVFDDEEIGCLVLEYCHSEPKPTEKGRKCEKVNYEEQNRLIMLAICHVHLAGIDHGNLERDSERHIVMSNGMPRIVDLSCAEKHICLNHTPDKRGMVSDRPVTLPSCRELVGMEKRYGDSDRPWFKSP